MTKLLLRAATQTRTWLCDAETSRAFILFCSFRFRNYGINK